MESIVTEGILTIKALVMTKKVFEQLEKQTYTTIEIFNAHTLGWCYDGTCRWLVIKDGAYMKRCRNDYAAEGLYSAAWANGNHDRNALAQSIEAIDALCTRTPQIFLK